MYIDLGWFLIAFADVALSQGTEGEKASTPTCFKGKMNQNWKRSLKEVLKMRSKRGVAILCMVTLVGLFLGGCSNLGAEKNVMSMTVVDEDGKAADAENRSALGGGTPRDWMFGVPIGR